MIDVIVDNSLFRTNPVRFHQYFGKVYYALKDLNGEYNDFYRWYFHKVKNGIEKADRLMLVKEHVGQLVGVSILKKTPDENKISTFRVVENFQRFGIGQEMMLQTFDLLESSKPLITVSGERLHQFRNLLTRNGFEFHQEYRDYYIKGTSEFSFNGPIEEVPIISHQHSSTNEVLAGLP